jgi:hypothetical protein
MADSQDKGQENSQNNGQNNSQNNSEWQEGVGEMLWNREGKRVALSPVYRHPSLPGLFLYRGMSIADPPTSLLNFQIYHESSGRLLAWTQGDEDIGRVQASMLRRLGGIDWTRNLENFWLNGVALDDKAEKAIMLFNAEWGVWTY